MIKVQQADFDLAQEYQLLRQTGVVGAIATFTGLVRDFSGSDDNASLFLEHYPGMTEQVLERIVDEAADCWQIQGLRLIHRIGKLAPGDQIVFVGVASRHRADAFAAAEYIMDMLKTRAPFWKKEQIGEQGHWVEVNPEDQKRAASWLQSLGENHE